MMDIQFMHFGEYFLNFGMKFSKKELVQTDGDFIGEFISRGYIPAEFCPLE